ncbi:MAG: hypothetical protein H7Y36_06470 [Armatimonadetes bacterium]|nr:hypothetical protein [Akkermansiaceae bacterium]
MKPTVKSDLLTKTLALGLLCLVALSITQTAYAQTTLWRVGLENGTRTEFDGALSTPAPTNYAVPSDWNTRTTFPEWAGISHGTWDAGRRVFDAAISYNLATVPAHGAEFQIKTINAGKFVPQLAVFSNGKLAGIINMIGTRHFNDPSAGTTEFGDLYRVYIPKEFLQTGTNTLRLKKLAQPYAANATDSLMASDNTAYLSFEYDYFKIVALASPATEPIHGRYINLNADTPRASGGFAVDDAEVAQKPKALRWLGTAYSGNLNRATFWRDVQGSMPRRLEYLQMLRDMNMQVILDYYSRLREPAQTDNQNDWTINAQGQLLPGPINDINSFFTQFGGLAQYYELSNEPCNPGANDSFLASKAVAAHISSIRPSHLKLVAPGYAFNNGAGFPHHWDFSVQNRRELEAHVQATNCHAYRDGYVEAFEAALNSYAPQNPAGYANGLPLEFVNTEHGVNDGMFHDFSEFGVNEKVAATFDRNIRGHIGFAHKFIVYAAGDGGGSFNLFDGTSPDSWTAHIDPTAGESTLRLTIFRQYALAYATHGKPLPFTFLNEADVTNKLAYFRAVDTSAIPALPGSGGKSDKILLNFVNFDKVAQTISVRVTMPQAGTYAGERFGAQNTYNAARSTVSLNATPTVDLTVTLAPRESVQYILRK